MQLELFQKPAINDLVERMEGEMLRDEDENYVKIDCPLQHFFSDGVYVRQIFMPKGARIIGHAHKTRHLNVVLQGKARVNIAGVVSIFRAGDTFESAPGVRKVLYIEEDCIWQTIHVTTETDLETLEELLIEKSQTFLQYHEDARQLELAQSTAQ